MKPRDFLLGSQIKNIPQTWDKAYVLKESYDELKEKLDIARQGLAFYADHAKWEIEDIGGMTHPQEWKKIDGDNGFTAIQALAKIGAGE